MSGAVGEAMIRSLMEEGNLKKIALLWTQGADIPWGSLHDCASARRIELPTYPFRTDRYWMTPGDTSEQAPLPPLTASAEPQSGPSGQRRATRSEIRRYITGFLGKALDIPEDQIQARASLEEYGVDSLTGRRLLRGLEETFAIVLTGREMLDNRCVEALTELVLMRKEACGNPGGNPGDYLQDFRKGLLGVEDMKRLISQGVIA